MQLAELFLIESEEPGEISKEDLIARYPAIAKAGGKWKESDLEAIDEWMDNEPLKYRLMIEPMSKFAQTSKQILIKFRDEDPSLWSSEKSRIGVIMKAIQRGEPQYPIFVDATGSHQRIKQLYSSIMEGYHRIVAFCLLKMPSVPVVYVSYTND